MNQIQFLLKIILFVMYIILVKNFKSNAALQKLFKLTTHLTSLLLKSVKNNTKSFANKN